MAGVLFKTGTRAQFDALTAKNPNALYWIYDTQELYKGDIRFGVGTGAGGGGAGAKGDKGDKGDPGLDGKSAYELAKDGGFDGTLEAWLASLKGEKGDSGLSAYEQAVAAGYPGTEEEWLERLAAASMCVEYSLDWNQTDRALELSDELGGKQALPLSGLASETAVSELAERVAALEAALNI